MMTRSLRRRARATTFVLPAFVLHLTIVGVPILSLFWLGSTDWNGLSAPVPNGIDNYRRMILDDPEFHRSLANNLLYMVIFLTFPIIAGLLMAMITSRMGRGQMLVRALFFLPYVVSPVIAGKIFVIYYDPYFGIAEVFRQLGWESLASIQFLGNRSLALWSVAFVDYWHWWGFVMVIFLAALHQVDTSLYEASALDGARRLQQFWHVTLPQIRPTLLTLITVTVIGSFVTFDYIYVMTQGGPAGATEIASTWIYKQAFNRFDAGYAAALSVVVLVLCSAVYVGIRQLQRRWEDA